MHIAVTGRHRVSRACYLVRELAVRGHTDALLVSPRSDRTGFDDVLASQIEWMPGDIGRRPRRQLRLVAGCDAVVHSALYSPRRRVSAAAKGTSSSSIEEENVVGTR